MNKPTIAVIGQGFVGGFLTTVMAEKGFRVAVYDKAGKKAFGAHEWSHPSLEPISPTCIVNYCECIPEMNFTGVYFICLPTPMKEDGSCDISIIDGVLDELANISGERTVVIKSTVPPGSCDTWNLKYAFRDLHVIHNPDFLREATALEDMRNQDRIILGGQRPWINKVRDVYRVAFPNVPLFKTSAANSEMTKYVINTFLATKVSFANEIYQICEKLYDEGEDIDYDRIIELATLDKRLGTSHWQVPGPMPADDGSGKLKRGYSGSCFCKDINSLICHAKALEVDPKIMSACWEKNLEVRPERDWEKLTGRTVSEKKK